MPKLIELLGSDEEAAVRSFRRLEFVKRKLFFYGSIMKAKKIIYIALVSLCTFGAAAQETERCGFADDFDESKYKEVTFYQARKETVDKGGEEKYFKTKCHIVANTYSFGFFLGFYGDADRMDFSNRDTIHLHSFPEDIPMFTSVEIYYHYFVYAGESLYGGKRLDGWKVLDDVRFTGQKYVATDALKIRESPSLSAKQTGRLQKGERTTVIRTGEKAIIDGIESAWVKVRTRDGTEGWCFAGYLTDGTEHRKKPWTSRAP